MIGELILTSYTYDQGRVAINNSYSSTTSFNTLSAETYFSGSTNLYDIFGGGVNYWSAGTGTNAITVKNSLCIASSNYAIAEGYQTTANGSFSHSEGITTIANGSGTHAEGNSTTANGANSHSEGENTNAIGRASHVEGRYTTANGATAHAEGGWTTANGDYSHSQNLYTNSASYAETSFGRYNYTGDSANNGSWVDSEQLFVIGNGTGIGFENNAFTVYKNGNAIFDANLSATTIYGDYASFSSITASTIINNSKQFLTLSDAATVSWDYSEGYNASITLGGNRALEITNITNGDSGTLKVIQDGVGSRTLSLPVGSLVVHGGAGSITLTSNPNAIDILSFVYDGTNLFWNSGYNFT